MSQPGYGPSGPYSSDNPPQGWGGAGQPGTPPPGDSFAPAPGQQPPNGYGAPQPPTIGQPPAGPGFGEQPPAAAPAFGESPAGGYAEPPASGPGYVNQPASGPGYAVQPASGPGYANQPASGPGFGAGPQPTTPFTPMSAGGGPGFDPGAPGPQHTMALPPVSGPGGPGGPGGPASFGTEPGGRRRGPWIPVLAGAAALFLIISATMTVLYVSKNGAYNGEKKVAAERQSTIKDQKKKIDDLNKQLASTKDKLDKANQNLSGAKNKNKDLADQKATVSKCLSLLEEALQAAGKNDEKKFRKLWNELQKPCDKADNIIH